MAIFPLQHPESNMSLIKHTCNLYRFCFLKVLPLSIALIGIFHLFRFGSLYVPANKIAFFQQLMMFIGIFSLPLFSMMVDMMLKIGASETASYREAIIIASKKFLGVIACFISIIFTPLVFIGIGMIIYFLLARFVPNLHPIVFYLVQILIAIAAFIAFVPKCSALIFLFSENKDPNSAVDCAGSATKLAYARTLFLSLYGLGLLTFIAFIPSLFQFLTAQNKVYAYVLEGIVELALIVLLPWVVALFVMQAKDLYFRWEEKRKKEEEELKANFKVKNHTKKEINF